MLHIEGLVKRFGSVVALDGVTVHIPMGQMVGIIGRSGAGKSTFLRLINRLIEPTQGTIQHRGITIGALRGRQLRAWRARCAMIFQQFNLVNRLDVLTNVLIGRLNYHWTLPTLVQCFSAAERALALRALQRLDLLPQALQRADTLSGGQQQRVAIARALVQEPHLILADEPIASLDPHNATRVMTALRAINREDGITVICPGTEDGSGNSAMRCCKHWLWPSWEGCWRAWRPCHWGFWGPETWYRSRCSTSGCAASSTAFAASMP